MRARSASGLLDALGLGYDLPVGQAVYAIDAFPDDDLLWRIEWIGGVGYNTSILVFPDSEKDWLTETIIPRPLREFYLADHHRFDPMATLHFGSSQPLVPAAPSSGREV